MIIQEQENVLWKIKTNDRVYSSTPIVDEVVCFGSDDHRFYAVPKNTGV
jgi:outer membrane protein assembly factor BamB